MVFCLFLVEQAKAHVLIRLLRFLLGWLCSGGWSSSGSSGCRSGSCNCSKSRWISQEGLDLEWSRSKKTKLHHDHRIMPCLN